MARISNPGIKGDPGTSGLEAWTRYSPAFTATGLTFTGTGATYPTYNSYYIKTGKLVSFVIDGTEDNPAVVITLYADGKPTETIVAHRRSTLRAS